MTFFPNGNSRFTLALLARSTSQVRELTVSMMIREFAGSAIMLFEPIYLLTKGYSIPVILLFYAAVYLAYLFLAPLGGKFIRAHGYEHGIIYSTPFLVFYYLSFYAVGFTPWAFIPAVLCIALSKTLFWVGFHADFARFGSPKGSQGSEISTFSVLATVASIFGPLAGGAILTYFGFMPLFFGVATLFIISNLPLLVTPETFAPRELSYGDAWKRLAAPEHRRQVLTFLGYGQELIGQALWPLYMFLAVPGYAALGAIGSLATVATVFLAKAVGRLTDHTGRHRMLAVGTLFHVLTWFLRIAALSPTSVLVAHALSRTSNDTVGIPLIALTYDYARQYSVTKTALLLEMSVALAKLFTALAAAALFYFLPNGWNIAFVGAAGLTLLYLFARRAYSR